MTGQMEGLMKKSLLLKKERKIGEETMLQAKVKSNGIQKNPIKTKLEKMNLVNCLWEFATDDRQTG